MISGELKLTKAYLCWKKFHDGYLQKANIPNVLNEARKFYNGDQYDSVNADLPRPIFNICAERIDKTVAKILETPLHVSFVADIDTENLDTLDNFYEYQLNEMDDTETKFLIARAGCIDGIGVAFTSFDEDTLGTASPFRGFLKRQVIPFEQTFWENPYTSDPQDQEYIGYYYSMEIGAVKKLVEEDDENTKEEKEKLIVPEQYTEIRDVDYSDINNKIVNVYVRMFRIDGEVAFELCTKYCNIFSHPHFLNPRKNEQVLKELANELRKKENKEVQDEDREITDYEMDTAKYTLFTKAKSTTENEVIDEKSKFYRYPVSVFCPLPITNSIIGESFISKIIPNQKIINYTYLMQILIMQSHAMPKILAKPEALNGQEYDNSPNQVIFDYTPISSGVQWGITRLSSGDAVNSNLFDLGSGYISLTRQINGFDNVLQNATADTSGYLYQQAVQQSNITLVEPQKRFWQYIKNNARIDLMYFKHYIPKAKYYVSRSASEMELQDNYRSMAQNLIDNNKIAGIPNGSVLPKTQKVVVKEINNDLFAKEFDVSVEVEQGVASSIVSESQHFQQIFQYIVSGNVDYDKIKLLVENDPAFSAKTRQRLLQTIEAQEISQIQIQKQQIEQLKSYIQQMLEKFKEQQYSIDYLKQRDNARNKAFTDSLKTNQEAVNTFINNNKQSQMMSESEVKSQNAKGISGGSFSSSSD